MRRYLRVLKVMHADGKVELSLRSLVSVGAGLAVGLLVFCLVSVFVPRPQGSVSGVSLSLVIPATEDDYLCFAEYIAEALFKMDELPDECIFVVSGWQNAADEDSK